VDLTHEAKVCCGDWRCFAETWTQQVVCYTVTSRLIHYHRQPQQGEHEVKLWWVNTQHTVHMAISSVTNAAVNQQAAAGECVIQETACVHNYAAR
jgi:hypothetical protein